MLRTLCLCVVILSCYLVTLTRRADAAEESLTNRSKSHATALVGFGIVRSSYDVGVFVNKDDLADFQYSSYPNSLGGNTTVSALGYTVFNGNSFYWWNGIGYRRVQIANCRLCGTTRLKRDTFIPGEYDDISWDTGIGNRWQWQNFTLGAEWLGIFFTGAKVKHTLKDESDKEATKEEKKHQIKDDLVRTANFRVLTVHLGMSF